MTAIKLALVAALLLLYAAVVGVRQECTTEAGGFPQVDYQCAIQGGNDGR